MMNLNKILTIGSWVTAIIITACIATGCGDNIQMQKAPANCYSYGTQLVCPQSVPVNGIKVN